MGLQETIMAELKTAMKLKDKIALESLRAVKAEILKAQTEKGAAGTLDEAKEIKILQRMVKQRKESARLFMEQNREDLAEPELAQVSIIEKFLPKQLSAEELTDIISEIITKSGANSPKDMGKIMGMANKELSGKAEGKIISSIVKELLNNISQ